MATKNKTTFMRSDDKKDFIGKLIFPCSPEITTIFLKKSVNIKKQEVYYGGELIDTIQAPRRFLDFLVDIGYELKPIESTKNYFKSVPDFDNIPILAQIYNGEILVSYHARDIIEVASRGKHILNKVLELTGISGHGKVYGNMERC